MYVMSSVLDKANQLLTPKKNQEFFYNFLAQTENEYYDDSPGVDKTKKIKRIIYKKIINTNKNYTEIINEYLDSYKANMYQLQEYIFDDHFLEIYKEKNDLEDVLISLNKIIVSRFEYLLLDDLDIKFKLKNNIFLWIIRKL